MKAKTNSKLNDSFGKNLNERLAENDRIAGIVGIFSEDNKSQSWCKNCGHNEDEHGGDSLDDVNHCVGCQDNGFTNVDIFDCLEFVPCKNILEVVKAVENFKNKEIQKVREQTIEHLVDCFNDSLSVAWHREEIVDFLYRKLDSFEKVDEK